MSRDITLTKSGISSTYYKGNGVWHLYDSQQSYSIITKCGTSLDIPEEMIEDIEDKYKEYAGSVPNSGIIEYKEWLEDQIIQYLKAILV